MMSEKEARENAKWVLTVKAACEHAWNIDCHCHLPCQTDECYEKDGDEMVDCMCKHFIEEIFS